MTSPHDARKDAAGDPTPVDVRARRDEILTLAGAELERGARRRRARRIATSLVVATGLIALPLMIRARVASTSLFDPPPRTLATKPIEREAPTVPTKPTTPMKPTTQTPPRLDFVVVSSSGGAQYPFVEIATAPSSKLRVETVTHRGNTALALWEILPNEDLEAALSETGLCIKPIQFGQTFRLFDCVTAQLVNVGQPSS